MFMMLIPNSKKNLLYCVDLCIDDHNNKHANIEIGKEEKII